MIRRWFGIFAILLFNLSWQCTDSKKIVGQPNMAVQSNYEDLWKKVKDLDEKGLPESAVKLVDSIYAKAKSDQNENQIVKALIHKIKYNSLLDEDGLVNGIDLVENELVTSRNAIERSMLYSYAAELYSRYLDTRLYEIQNRTATVGDLPNDVNQWSKYDFFKKIRAYYVSSVKEQTLKTSLVKPFETVLTDDVKTDKLRPTLYDILSHRAVEFFKSSMSDLDILGDDAMIDDPLLFSPTDQFKNSKTDTNAIYGQVIRLFQDVENFHQKDNDPAAYYDVVSNRLEWVYERFTGAEKEQKYEAALEQWIHQSGKNQYGFLLNKAQLYRQLGGTYNAISGNKKYQLYLIKAKDICTQIIKEYPGTPIADKAYNLLIELNHKTVNSQVEQVNLPGQPFRIHLQYQNIDHVWIKIVQVNDDLRKRIYSQPFETTFNNLISINPVWKSDLVLPASEDMQSHAAEIKIDALPASMYAILISNGEGFKYASDFMALMYTHVSALASLQNFNYEYLKNATKKEFVIVDRKTGAPIVGANLSFYETRYNPSTQKNDWIETNKGVSDQEGKYAPNLDQNKSYTVKISRGNDVLWLMDGFYNYSNAYLLVQGHKDALIFTDRSLYRPGQLVYFKVLALYRDENGLPVILKNQRVNLNYKDANGQTIASQILTTNDYGSCKGSFTIPVSGLNGYHSITTDLDNASASIQVEEYKRPKFEITFDTNKIESRLNENVIIAGHAQNYAGNVIDQADVKYKVMRSPWIKPMPWWWGGWERIMPHANPVIIAHGNTTTDAQGKFTIPFVAVSDPSMANEDDAKFDYSVEVDVTDFTGETRSNNTSLRIGKKPLDLSTELNSMIQADSLTSLLIHTKDLNNVPVQAKGNLSINKLIAPSVIYRNRYWQESDQYLYSEKEYHTWFPSDVYKDESVVSKWKVEKNVFNSGFDGNTAVRLASKLEPGIYKLEASALDHFHQTSTLEFYFWVYDESKGIYPANKILQSFQYGDDVLEPGHTLSHHLVSMIDRPFILQTSSEVNTSKWLPSNKVNNASNLLNESMRGKTYSINWHTVYDNRFYTHSFAYSIPWSNKELTIETLTFRDKLLPGQNEEWKLKISGPQKEKFISEVVADLYDQSLDAISPHPWPGQLFGMQFIAASNYNAFGFRSEGCNNFSIPTEAYKTIEGNQYHNLNWYGMEVYGGRMYGRGGRVMMKSMRSATDAVMQAEAVPPPATATANAKMKDGTAGALDKDEKAQINPIQKQSSPPPPRKNLNETVFFLPDLKTDGDGNLLIKFKMNEALTKWRFMVFGHTQDLKSGYLEKSVVTQKDLMVFPNAPRFVRQDDVLEFPAKVSNLSQTTLIGKARLELFDPLTNESLVKKFSLENLKTDFTVPAGLSMPLTWRIKVPSDYTGMLGYRVWAESGQQIDGEENVIPVMTNRQLVTETMPFQVRAGQTKDLTFTSMANKMNGQGVVNHSFTLECTSNPVWYAIQSLPYMMEFPFECTEQLVNRYFANALAQKIVETNPSIKNVLDAWNAKGDLKSPLFKNEELKTAVLNETPWVREALKENEQQKLIALLFDVNRMASEKQKVIDILQSRQLFNGGFPWFAERDDWYITQYVVEELGHLKKLGLLDNVLDEVLNKAVAYCDRELVKNYNEMRKMMKKEDIGLNEMAIHYLYARSFYIDIPIEDKSAFNYYILESEKSWLQQGLYNQGLISLALHRWNPESKATNDILSSLNERAQHNDDLGMYWKIDAGYRFFEMPVETQALLIEAFDEIRKDSKLTDEMRLWLLKNKQTNHWSSTKATASAIYALMSHGSNWISNTKLANISIGGNQLVLNSEQVVPSLGYFKIQKQKSEVTKDLASIKVSNSNNHVVWGAAYWQYFQDLDKITNDVSKSFSISRDLFVESVDGNKKVLVPFTSLKVGDKVIVRLYLKIDRPMDYLHLKDLRASGLEPIDIISGYHWQGGMGYYQVTKDLSTNFFIDHVSAGNYTIEYALRVAQNGMFSNGISMLQCMYAPEFNAHTGGKAIIIK